MVSGDGPFAEQIVRDGGDQGARGGRECALRKIDRANTRVRVVKEKVRINF